MNALNAFPSLDTNLNLSSKLPTSTLMEQTCQIQNELNVIDEPGEKCQSSTQALVSGHNRL